MPNFNQFIGMGHLTRDPELRYTPKGTAICGCGIAINRNWKSEGGEQQTEVLFLDLTAWGRRGEVFSQYLKKGSAVHIQGYLKLDQWEDRQTGAKRSKISCTVENFQFLDGKDGEGGGRPRDASADHRKDPFDQQPDEPTDNELPEDDDVPF